MQVFLLLDLTWLSGCFSFSRPNPEVSYYLIEVERPESRKANDSSTTLSVNELRTSAITANPELIYKDSSNQYVNDFYNRFFMPIGPMISQELRQWLKNSGLFQNVTSTSSLIEPDFILEGAINKIQGDFGESSGPSAVLEIQILLLHNKDSGADALFQRNYAQSVSIKSTSAQDLVQGLEQALEKILQNLEADIAKLNLTNIASR